MPSFDRRPSLQRLEQLLRSDVPDARVLERTRNTYTSTAPSEVVVCEMSDGKRLSILCKYFFADIVAADRRSHGTHDSRNMKELQRAKTMDLAARDDDHDGAA